VTLITACLIAVVLPLVEGRQAGWPAWSWAALAAAAPLVIAFVIHQRRKADRGGVPLLNPRVFASWQLRAGLLTQTVLSHADPATAGSVSGALSTAQQVGNSVGVAVTGVLFFGALSDGYGLAFERSTLQMGALLLVVAALTRLMPGRQRAA
jgi:hypothetical protein